MGLHDFNLPDVIERNAQLYKDKTAFIDGDRRVTHGEYANRVGRLARGLSRVGIRAGDRIAVLAHNCLEYVDIYGAAACIGAIVVPLNWRLGSGEIAHAIENTTPKLLIAATGFLPALQEQIHRFAFVERSYCLGAASASFAQLGDLMAGENQAELVKHPDGDCGFVIIHTASVDGKARGALLSQGGLVAANLQFAASWNLGPCDVLLGVLPLFHALGLGLLLAVQQAGGTTVLMAKFEAAQTLEIIRSEAVTVMAEFPPMLSTLLEQPGAREQLASLRHVTGLDTAQTIDRFEAEFPLAKFWVVYGQTEVSGPVSFSPYRERPGSAGRPTMLNRVVIVDDADRPVQSGTMGEIVVRGPMVFLGYWNCEEENAFISRGDWHHTGDIGRIDSDGYLWYGGRSPAKELIKPGGENVYPVEVEKILLEHPSIAQAVVFGVPDPQWGEAIKAVCVCKPGQTAEPQELIDFVGGRIARFKRPKHVVFVESLPRNDQGLIDRASVKRSFA